MSLPTDEDRRIAQEGCRFRREEEADPLWTRVTIRLRLQRTLPPSSLVESVGHAAAERFLLFCAGNLFGAGLLTAKEADRIKEAIKSAYAFGTSP